MRTSNAWFAHGWNLPSVCFLTIIVGAVVLTPSQASARYGAIIGGIAGIAAAAIIANEIARTQRYTPVRVVKYRNRAPKAAVAQKEAATSDPFARVTASKVRSDACFCQITMTAIYSFQKSNRDMNILKLILVGAFFLQCSHLPARAETWHRQKVWRNFRMGDRIQ